MASSWSDIRSPFALSWKERQHGRKPSHLRHHFRWQDYCWTIILILVLITQTVGRFIVVGLMIKQFESCVLVYLHVWQQQAFTYSGGYHLSRISLRSRVGIAGSTCKISTELN